MDHTFTSLFCISLLMPRLVEIGILCPPMKCRAVQRDLLPLTEKLQRRNHYNVLHSRGGMHMQTQSMTVTVMYENASTLDHRLSTLISSCDWSEAIWDLRNEE